MLLPLPNSAALSENIGFRVLLCCILGFESGASQQAANTQSRNWRLLMVFAIDSHKGTIAEPSPGKLRDWYK